ncbi:hypothetical protein [Kamptonema sp. UHCC 0994]|uniref:hypothetical protein n=1 Tax=Kamptonema sp. UHCC 0994 TaxID=3031329 RepID=UPI0023B8F858|nr:hypothetical protein [Kamptonema sp. UHCC 0994]MDF0552197.1 hypothetical protein [Kamptonema sp. UHCC 0994]
MDFDESLLPVFSKRKNFGEIRGINPDNWRYVYAIVYVDNNNEISTELFSNNPLSYQQIETLLRELCDAARNELNEDSCFIKMVSLNQLKPKGEA